MKPLKLMTVVGTRPEIIRLSRLIPQLDAISNHLFVHTGQNSDPRLSEVFFADLNLRNPDVYLGVDNSSVGSSMAGTIQNIEVELRKFEPDAVLILGDTNSAISAVVAERMQIPVYHMEAGNRSHDANVPEELNRKMVDHVATFNLPYNEHSRRNLLSEGISPRFISVTGSPMMEVLNFYHEAINASDVLARHSLESEKYFLASFHRQENVDVSSRLKELVATLDFVASKYGLPVIISTHPRTKKRLENLDLDSKSASLRFVEPFGFLDYVKLQQNAFCVLSDSGTISEESAILGFPAVSIRSSIERQEAIESGGMILTGLDSRGVVLGIEHVTGRQHTPPPPLPEGYDSDDFSARVIGFIISTVFHWRDWKSLRMLA